jgi:hypothetical protein
VSLIKDIKIALDPEREWRRRGWGEEHRYPVTGSDGQALVLTFRVPVEWDTIDVMKLRADAAAPDGSLARALVMLSREVETTGAIAVVGIARTVPREGKPDASLFAVLTFAVSDLPGPAPAEIPGAEVEPIELNHPGLPYKGVRIRRIRDATVPSGQQIPVLTVQYLVDTGHGWLATTFATPQPEVFERLVPLLDKIASACWLDPAVSPTDANADADADADADKAKPKTKLKLKRRPR